MQGEGGGNGLQEVAKAINKKKPIQNGRMRRSILRSFKGEKEERRMSQGGCRKDQVPKEEKELERNRPGEQGAAF